MVTIVLNIIIQQITPYTDANGNPIQRNLNFSLNVCHSFEALSTWKTLTDTATVVLPKNIYVVSNGKNVPWGPISQSSLKDTQIPSQQYISGFPVTSDTPNPPPLFMRGDQITIQAGYDDNLNTIFTGFISSVNSEMPITLKCEDNMWKCKQVAAINKNYPGATDNMGKILEDFTTQTGYQVERAPQDNAFGTLNIGNFRIMNETWAKVFEKLRKDHRLFFYFRGNILRGGGIVYYPEDMNTVPFVFAPSSRSLTPVIKSSLEYRLKSDVVIGAVCYSVNSVKSVRPNAKGVVKQTTGRFTCNVPAQVSASGHVTSTISKLDSTEWFTFYFEKVTSLAQLANLGNTQLAKYYYDGFRGNFITFGMPQVIFGNIVNLTDEILPERTGNYLVKSVKTYFSVDAGLRQEIELHFRTDNIPQNELILGL